MLVFNVFSEFAVTDIFSLVGFFKKYHNEENPDYFPKRSNVSEKVEDRYREPCTKCS